jgi:DNA adenine methylase
MSSKAWRKPKNLWKDFSKWSKRLQFVTVENLSFEEMILKYDSPNTLFYLDPPYYEYEKYYKGWWFNKSQHILLRDLLKQVKGRFILSYNDCKEIRELYKDFTVKSSKEINYTLWSNVHKRKKVVSELYITNY